MEAPYIKDSGFATETMSKDFVGDLWRVDYQCYKLAHEAQPDPYSMDMLHKVQ